MKPLLISIICIFSIHITHGQRVCGTVFNPSQVQQTDNPRYQRYLQLEQFTANYKSSLISNNSQERLSDANGLIIIPVVVHVIHGSGEAIGVGRNISVAQVQSQIDVLNEDFRRLNADAVNTPPAFAGVAADITIEFRLACTDPNGNATDGITRTASTTTSFTDNDDIKFASRGGHDAWPPDRYLNIWVSALSGGLLGYAQLPSDYATNPTTDGVVINTTSFGRVGNVAAPFQLGRTATHEVGHWLNLFHIWGDDGSSCSGSDQCGDTPNQAGENYGCPAFPHTDACTSSGNGVMFMNYMDYVNDACMNLFTNDQRIRMRAVFAQGGPRAAFITNYFRINFPQYPEFCTSTVVTLSNVSCLPVTWSIVSGPGSISNPSNSQATLNATGNGKIVVRATSGNYYDEMTYFAGPPVIASGFYNSNGLQYGLVDFDTDEDNEVCFVYNPTSMNTTMTVWGAPSATWTKTYPTTFNGLIWGQSDNFNLGLTFRTIGLQGIFKITATNACGSVERSYKFISIDCRPSPRTTHPNVLLTPTPANSVIRVTVNNDNLMLSEPVLLHSITAINIYDAMGRLRKTEKFPNAKTASLNISDLNTGMYFIEIWEGNKKVRKILPINR